MLRTGRHRDRTRVNSTQLAVLGEQLAAIGKAPRTAKGNDSLCSPLAAILSFWLAQNQKPQSCRQECCFGRDRTKRRDEQCSLSPPPAIGRPSDFKWVDLNCSLARSHVHSSHWLVALSSQCSGDTPSPCPTPAEPAVSRRPPLVSQTR